MSNELQISNTSNPLVPDASTMNSISFMAKQANNSKFYNSLGGEAGILSIMLLARELDIPLMQAISGGIWNIQGKVEMSAHMMNMKIRKAGHDIEIISNNERCTIKGKRKDTGREHTSEFTIKDAEIAGLASKTVWKQYPKRMLFNRCLSDIARVLFPDVIGNCYVEGEIKESIEVENYDKKQKNHQPISPENLEVADVQISTPSIQEEEICSEEVQLLIEALGSDMERLEKLLSFYQVSSVIQLSRVQFNDAMRRTNSKK